MSKQAIEIVAGLVDYIEQQIANPNPAALNLSAIADAAGYSRFHLHRMFTQVAGLPLHAYLLRRRLTEAAGLLVKSNLPLPEIALLAGYDSQQAFTAAFRAMYKLPPAAYRERREFYPLQLPLRLYARPEQPAAAIRWARPEDMADWLQLVRQSIAGYPHWHEAEYCRHLRASIARQQALLIPGGNNLAAAMAFSAANGSIDFLAVQPQYRQQGLAKTLLQKLRRDILPRQTLFTTTFRAGDRAATGQRQALRRLGFAESELLWEFGYPTQRFVLEGQNYA